jgi:hypothetical protein
VIWHAAFVVIRVVALMWFLGLIRLIVGEQCGLLAAVAVAVTIPIVWGFGHEWRKRS